MENYWIYTTYLVCATLFILGIKALSHPKRAAIGNLLASLGMLTAVIITLCDRSIIQYEWIITGLIVGTLIGSWLAINVEMAAMPQMVALFNGFGGGASLFVALAYHQTKISFDLFTQSFLYTTLFIGAITLIGSLVAFAKLQELIPSRIRSSKHSIWLNLLCLVAALTCGTMAIVEPYYTPWLYGLLTISCLLGFLLVIPIGGADMPVVIALLNSYSGIAAASAGFITNNTLLIIAGSLVGTSGLILTQLMCRAMNRSLFNVLLGAQKLTSDLEAATSVYQDHVISSSPDEVAVLLENAKDVVIVPGFGLAMAQAQHAVRELATLLEKNDIKVRYAIHPVAGRMPGHMNVLLAEAEVPYEQLFEMDHINPHFKQTDVVIVVGANDVINPMAREDQNSPIYGMPILNVDQAKTVVVIKRSLNPGFAGLPNPLFSQKNTLMLYGDAKQTVIDLAHSLKEAS